MKLYWLFKLPSTEVFSYLSGFVYHFVFSAYYYHQIDTPMGYAILLPLHTV
jgi:hypothetical protein